MINIMRYIFLSLLFPLCLNAQQGGSNYSLFGIGDIRQSIGGTYDGLAGSQYAVPSYHAVNIANPAMWSESKMTRLQVGFRFSQAEIQQGSLTAHQNFAKVDGITATFQVDTAMGITVSGGIYPYSVVQYSINTPVTPGVSGINDLNGGSLSYGKGGLTAAFIGASWKPFQSLSLGFSAIGLFGRISRVVQTELYTQPYISVNQRTDNFAGSGIKLGAVLYPGSGFRIGMSGALYSSLDYTADYRQSTLNTGGVAYDTVFSAKSSTDLPAVIGAGISYSSGKWMITADGEVQDFSTFSYLPGKSSFKTSQRISVGISRLPNYQLGLPYIDKIQFNAGLGYRQLYYSFDGKDINEMFGSFGMQLPVSGSAMIDLGLQAGIRGMDAAIKESFLRFSFSISAGEIWFKPFARE